MEPSPAAPEFERAAGPDEGPSSPRWAPAARRAVAVLTVLVFAGLAVLMAIVAAFELPPIMDPTLLPRLVFAYALAAVGNLLLVEHAGRASGSRAAALVPAVAWLLTIVYFAWGRVEGDTLYLLQTYLGVFLMPVGMFGAAVGLARARPNPARPARMVDAPESSNLLRRR
jgi:hypothetical protein